VVRFYYARGVSQGMFRTGIWLAYSKAFALECWGTFPKVDILVNAGGGVVLPSKDCEAASHIFVNKADFGGGAPEIWCERLFLKNYLLELSWSSMIAWLCWICSLMCL